MCGEELCDVFGCDGGVEQAVFESKTDVEAVVADAGDAVFAHP